MGWYLRNWGVYDFDFYLFEISIKNPNFWYMSRVTAFRTETFYNFYWGVKENGMRAKVTAFSTKLYSSNNSLVILT